MSTVCRLVNGRTACTLRPQCLRSGVEKIPELKFVKKIIECKDIKSGGIFSPQREQSPHTVPLSKHFVRRSLPDHAYCW